MHIEPRERPGRGLRLAPLVDVVFLLLVFFMLVARLETPQTISIEPPSMAGGGVLEGSVLVRLGPQGRLDLNGLVMDVDRLATEVGPYLRREPQPPILVQPADGVRLQALVQVLDALKRGGAEDLTLIEP